MGLSPLCFAAAAVAAGLTGRYYDNAMLLGSPVCSHVDESDTLLNTTAPFMPCATAKAANLLSARWDGSLVGAEVGMTYQFAVMCSGKVRFWIHGWKMVDAWQDAVRDTALIGIWNFTARQDLKYPVRVEFQTQSPRAFLQLYWRKSDSDAFVPIPAAACSPAILPAEVQREKIQNELAKGWNTWHRASAAAHVHLPTGFGFQLAMETASGNTSASWDYVDKCLHEEDCKVRPGRHSLNGSITEITTRPADKLNVTITSVHLKLKKQQSGYLKVDPAQGDAVVVLLQANDSVGIAPYSVTASASYFFDCDNACGNTSNVANTIVANSPGLSPMVLQAVSSVSAVALLNRNSPTLTARFSDGLACFVAFPSTSSGAFVLPRSSSECLQLISTGRMDYDAELDSRFSDQVRGSGGTRDSIEAIRSVMGWNTMYDMRIKVASPVSRNFGVQPFSLWLWDTYFCTLLAAEAEDGNSGRNLAYSNLIEVTRPTVKGNVPGIRTVDQIATDRSKPFVGALVLREHWRKYGDVWIVSQVFDDLLMWTNWVGKRRTLAPLNLIALGSDNLPEKVQGGSSCSTKHAVWESGLDNSPMYDGLSVMQAPSEETCFIPLYDVGMTGLYLSMLECLAEMADVLGRNSTATDLRARHANMSAALNAHLWSEELEMYCNKRSDTGELSPRISPFNFHAMLAGAATEERAERMVKRWLFSDGGFCLHNSSTGKVMPPGQTPDKNCNYGLPSIAHNDSAYGDQDYWRGRVWGPMNYLVYAGLSHPRYSHIAVVQVAKKLLADTSQILFMKEWLSKHHVHENYGADSGLGDDARNSNPFYHWGALLGYIAIKQESEGQVAQKAMAAAGSSSGAL